jgi:hypothetical protein
MMMKHSTTKILYAYWDKVRGDRVTPRRFEIEPASIASILPDTFILERIDAETFRYRLAGTRVCDVFGLELRGSNFFDGWSPVDRLSLIRHFVALAKQGAVELIHLEAAPVAKLSVPFEILLLPLRHTGENIDRVLGSFCALAEPHWLGEIPLTTKRLIANELIWPAGGASAPEHEAPENRVLETRLPDNRFSDQIPMMIPGQHTRIVRTDRRQFRVFDGGLSRADEDKG